MSVTLTDLPTPLSVVCDRLERLSDEPSASRFLATSYVSETLIKLSAIALISALREGSRDHAHRIAYNALHSDGLGAWEVATRAATTHPAVTFVAPEMHPFIAYLTKRRTKPEDDWFREAAHSLNLVISELGFPDNQIRPKATVRDAFVALVFIRNKTKAHGAAVEEFFSIASLPYARAVAALMDHCPLLEWSWLYLERRAAGKMRALSLRGSSPKHLKQEDADQYDAPSPGVYVVPLGSHRRYRIGSLIRANHECTAFTLPNASIDDSGFCEFLDYANGRVESVELSEFVVRPTALPPSETEGRDGIDVHSNVFANLPAAATGYVERPALQAELRKRLLDKNHAIITLHGRGGIGKTSLALWMCHKLSAEQAPPFDAIVWFSARDLDLRPTGPVPVEPRVVHLEGVARAYGSMFAEGTGVDVFARALEAAGPDWPHGRLFVFDNFETMVDARGLHEFLDTHTILPNKVLITSRERAFKADFPIEVRGMAFSEAKELMISLGRELQIEGLIEDRTIRRVFEFSEGHAYVMRVLIGEMAKEGRYVQPDTVVSQRVDIVGAVFERSFNKLSQDAKHAFLLMASLKSRVSELALLVVLSQRGVDVEPALEECVRLAVIQRERAEDDATVYSAPPLARTFARKKLEGDPDRLVVAEDAVLVQKFGVINEPLRAVEESQVRRFVEWCRGEARGGGEAGVARADRYLSVCAQFVPAVWQDLAQLRVEAKRPRADAELALRRAVEECPSDVRAWVARADYALRVGDDQTRIAALIRAVDCDSGNVERVRDVALHLCRYVGDHKEAIPAARRGVYLASVREHMVRLADRLDATGLSRLAWLFLLEERKAEAWKYANEGCRKDEANEHCLRILERLETGGFVPPN